MADRGKIDAESGFAPVDEAADRPEPVPGVNDDPPRRQAAVQDQMEPRRRVNWTTVRKLAGEVIPLVIEGLHPR